MHPQIEEILEKPLGVRIAILGAAVALLVGVYWFAFFAPVTEEYAKVSSEVDRLRTEVSVKTSVAANLNRFKEEVAHLDVELNKALRELPDEKEIHLLLSKVSDKARDAGLDIRLFRPRGEQKKDFYAEVPVDIEVNGMYHQVGSFFDEVGHLERLVNLDEFAIVEPKKVEGLMNMKISVTATAFRFLDESERPKEVEKSGKKRRRAKPSNSNEGDI